jgi:hypothetical protein
MMTITFARPDRPVYEVTVPTPAVQSADTYATANGFASAEHLILRYLLDQLLVSRIIPLAQLPQEVNQALSAINLQLAELARQSEEVKLAPFLPELRVGGQVITLPEIEQQLAVQRAQALAEQAAAAAQAQLLADNPQQ